MKKLLFVLMFLGLLTACSQSSRSSLSVEETKEGIWVYEGDQKVLFYQAAPKSPADHPGEYNRGHYIHPLYSMDGNVITELFPADHLHHRGIFWSWHQIWVGDEMIGDPWEIRDWVWDVTDAKTSSNDDGSVTITAKVDWKSPLVKDDSGQMKVLIAETTDMIVYPKKDNYRVIDFVIRLLGTQPDMKIGGADDVKGYSGFSTRIVLPDDIKFIGEIGEVEPKNTSVEGGAWMDMSGSMTPNGISGITIFSHPENDGHPQPWILRRKRSMQNVVYPGRNAVPLSDKDATVLCYRLVIHSGEYDQSLSQKIYDDYKNK